MIKKYTEYLNDNFWEWFGDSIVVDENGNPRIMHHGSCKAFDKFDRKTIKYIGCNGDGFYFTPDANYAKTYGENVQSYYLKIENPLTPTTKILTKDDYNKLLDYIQNDEEYKDGLKNYGYFDDSEFNMFKQKMISEFANKSDYVSLFDLTNSATGSIKYIFDALKEVGSVAFDGVVSTGFGEWVIFDPSHIKSASKNNGTFSIGTDNIYEYAEYHQLHDEDEHNITRVVRDNHHEYEYCDGILYELSKSGEDEIVDIDEVEHTLENSFYSDQIERYVEYIKDGGVLETFPVNISRIGGAYNLDEICEYLGEPENFDLSWDILSKKHRGVMDIMGELSYNSGEYGISDDTLAEIEDKADLDEHYGKDYDTIFEDDDELYWTKEYYDAFCVILEYWDNNKEYTLTDMNHRFAAVKELGKSKVYVDPS